ncbi:MAG TPA: alanine racemase [Solirubrobacteraceae bacterium]|jgi:alanine racemase|nr:alanine racemase [Solirubrobacteraceae bacterium]
MSVDRAVARVNLDAIARNCERLRSELREGVQLCAVVKADGYGHGMEESARAALAGGATWFAVAGIQEARELADFVEETRPKVPLLIMGPLERDNLEEVVACGFDLVVWSESHLLDIAWLAADIGRPGRVHVKLDTGMGRFGTRDAELATRLAITAAADPNLDRVGLMTHFATADEPGDDFFAEQVRRFAEWTAPIKRAHPEVLVHAANSAAVLRDPAAHFDMVRCGIAVYGMDPFGEDPLARGLEPALRLSSHVAAVKRCAAGESTGYGRRFVATEATHLGLLPIGYGDGWRRGLSGNAEALIAGRRHPLVGTVSMDSVAVDLGPDPSAPALFGQPAVLIGGQGEERITAEELARRLGTINYEITCGLTARVARVHHGDDGVARLGAD